LRDHMEPELGWKEAIVAVLGAANAPLRIVEIQSRFLSGASATEQTATPE